MRNAFLYIRLITAMCIVAFFQQRFTENTYLKK